MKKIIYDITSFTSIDYKDHLSCIVWFIHCNMRCQYCYNCDIVSSQNGEYTIEDLMIFLNKRVGLLDGVVLSGGEASVHDLLVLCEKIKYLGFEIKLDTNGSNPTLLKELINKKLIDFVSLDFKATKEKYKLITKSQFYDKNIESLKTLLNSNVGFEVRTTLHNDLLNENDINCMQNILKQEGYNKTFYIQNFLECKNFKNLKDSQKKFDKSKLENILNIVFRN